jgi:hypothetical protein
LCVVRQEVGTERREAHVVTDAERLADVREKLLRWAYLSHHPDAERDMRWLLDRLDERDTRIERLMLRLRQYELAFRLP